MFSQNDEERVILEFFKGRAGNFLDIGAYDATEFSNTRQIALNGWSGIMVEPAPETFDRLARAYADNPRISLVNSALAKEYRWELFRYESHRKWSGTISQECCQKHDIKPTYSFWLQTVPVDRVYELGALMGMLPFHFVSIDAEWMDYEIIESSLSMLKGTELICVEKANRDWVPVLNQHGFHKLVHETPENILMSKP